MAIAMSTNVYSTNRSNVENAPFLPTQYSADSLHNALIDEGETRVWRTY